MRATQIKELIKSNSIQTPSYILDIDALTEHVNAMKTKIDSVAGLCYAMKANPFIVPTMAEIVDKIEVCSPGELYICQSYGIQGDKIIFSGVNKTKRDVEAALDYGVALITVESPKHFRLIFEYCKENNSKANVLLRLTNGSQFGMDAEDIESILSDKEIYKYINVTGIHYFSGTQKKKFDKLREEMEELNAFMLHVHGKYGLSDLTLEYGAGLPVPYFEGEDFDSLYAPLEMLVDIIKEKKRGYKVVLELGRFFTFLCGTYLTTVEDVKSNKGCRYVLVDGGIHHLNYYGQNMAMRVPKMELLTVEEIQGSDLVVEQEKEDYTICGSLCTLADVLVRKWNGIVPREGDVFAFYNAGSYSVTEAPGLFLSRRLPAIYSYSEMKGLEVVRASMESYLLNCKRF